MRRYALATSLLGLVAGVTVFTTAALGATSHITISDNYFTPSSLEIAVGDTAHWMRADSSADTHNVREDGRIFRSGNPTPGDIDFARTFSAGTFHYFCEGHGARSGKGMDGFVRVPVTIDPSPAGAAFAARWATGGTNTGTKFDVQYRIGSGAWRNWKTDVGSTQATLSARSGTRYSVRARSQKGTATSGWSPIVTITT